MELSSRLRRCVGIKYAQLNPLLDELAKEGMIGIAGETIFLLGRQMLYSYVTNAIRKDQSCYIRNWQRDSLV